MKSAFIYKQNNSVLYHLKTQKIDKSTNLVLKLDYFKNISSVAGDVLAPRVARSCTDMVLTLQNKRVHVFHNASNIQAWPVWQILKRH